MSDDERYCGACRAKDAEIERLRGILARIGHAAAEVLSHRREGAGGINLHVEWVSEQCEQAGWGDEHDL